MGPAEPVRDLPPPSIAGGNTQAISGLWDRSVEGNIYYTYLGENGEYTVYDYDQDANGTGLNCYRAFGNRDDRGRVLRPHIAASHLYLIESFYYQLVDEYANREELRHSSAIYRIEKTSDVALEFQAIECVTGERPYDYQYQTQTWSLVEGLSRDDLNICVNHPLDF